MLKAIETEYLGYRFRSRLEARWAVFFHTAGIPFEYEPEGFDLGDGLWYLPDFWLPKQKFWVEIKPERELAIEEKQKACKFQLGLSRSRVGEILRIISGTPHLDEYGFWDYEVLIPNCLSLNSLHKTPFRWEECPRCKSVWLGASSCPSGEIGCKEQGYIEWDVFCPSCEPHFPHVLSFKAKSGWYPWSTRLLRDAYRSACQARFGT